MDMPVNVPIDDPNADTEWYAEICSTGLRPSDAHHLERDPAAYSDHG